MRKKCYRDKIINGEIPDYDKKGVFMQVSAITQNDNCYNMSNSINQISSRYKEQIGDTSFNSLTPYNSNKRSVSKEKLPIVFDSVNQWKNFCHQRILGGKLNIIA